MWFWNFWNFALTISSIHQSLIILHIWSSLNSITTYIWYWLIVHHLLSVLVSKYSWISYFANRNKQQKRHVHTHVVARLTCNVEVVGSSPIKGHRCFLEQETLPLLLSTGWFPERIRAWCHNRIKINWGPYGRLT